MSTKIQARSGWNFIRPAVSGSFCTNVLRLLRWFGIATMAVVFLPVAVVAWFSVWIHKHTVGADTNENIHAEALGGFTETKGPIQQSRLMPPSIGQL